MRRTAPILAFAILLAAVVVLGRSILLERRVLSGPDVVNYFIPTAHFARGWLQQGVLPLWNPMTFCGWPLVGDAQLRWLYPPNLLLLLLDPAIAFSLLVILHIGFGTTGMWFYLRKAAAVGPWPALCGAATFGLAGFFACHLMSAIVVFPATGAWVPWILLLGWRVGRPGARATTVALFGVAIGAQVLSGSPQIVFFTWIALVLQALWCAVRETAAGWHIACSWPIAFRPAAAVLARYAAAGAIGIALGASSIIPASEFGALSLQRGGKIEWKYVTDTSLEPRYLWLTVAPRFFGNPHIAGTYWGGRKGHPAEGHWDICGYAGIGPLAALLVALLCWRSLFGKRQAHQTNQATPGQLMHPSAFAAFHLFLAALALALALGRHSPLFHVLYEWVPGFDRFRVPSRWLLLWQFSLATLFAIVLERCFRTEIAREAAKKRMVVALVVMVVLLIVAVAFSPALIDAAGFTEFASDFHPEVVRDLQHAAAGSLLRATAFALGWLIFFTAAGKKLAPLWRQALPVFATLLVLADVLSFGTSMPTTRTRQRQADEFYPRSPLVNFMTAGLEGHRFLALDDVHQWLNDQNQPELWANRATVAGLHDVRGYYPLCLRWFGQYVNTMSRRPARYRMDGLLSVESPLDLSLLSLLDVKFLLSYENLATPGLPLAQKTSFGLKIYGVVGTRGPAFLAKAYSTDGLSEEQEIALLAGGRPDTRTWALTSAPPLQSQIRNSKSEIARPGEVTLTRPTPNRIELDVDRGSGDLVVVSEAYHPGWRATADGERLRVVRANHALIGVYVPPGRHRIALVFEPASFRLGLYLSLGAWLILAAVGTATLPVQQRDDKIVVAYREARE